MNNMEHSLVYSKNFYVFIVIINSLLRSPLKYNPISHLHRPTTRKEHFKEYPYFLQLTEKIFFIDFCDKKKKNVCFFFGAVIEYKGIIQDTTLLQVLEEN